MRVTLTNLSTAALPISSLQDGGWCDMLMHGEPFDVDRDAVSVLTAGDHPEVGQLEHRAGRLFALLTDWLAFWRMRAERFDEQPMLRLDIRNQGSTSLEVILGDPAFTSEIVGGGRLVCTSRGWLELRELAS